MARPRYYPLGAHAPLPERVSHLQTFLARYFHSDDGVAAAPAPAPSGPASFEGDAIPESAVIWDPVGGHNHDGTVSRAVDHASLTGVTANQHHNQSHVLATTAGLGTDHTVSGLTAGQVLQASSATAALFAQLAHGDLSGVTANQHHNQSHVLATSAALGADHTVSGLTTGHVLTALSATTAAFQPPPSSGISGLIVQENDATVEAAATTLDFLGADFDVSSSPAGEANVQLAATLTANARVAVSKNSGATVGTRRRVNLIEGSGVTLTVADDGANEEVDVTIAAGGAGKCYFGGWERTNISTGATTSKTAMSWVGSSANLGEVMPTGGTILGCSVITGGDIGGAGKAYEVEVYTSTDGGVSWSASGVVATITGGAGAADQWAWASSGSATFITGTALRLYDQRTGAVSAVDCHGGIFVRFD